MLPVVMALTALRYVKYFPFCGNRHVFTPWGQWGRIKHDTIVRRSSLGGGTSWMYKTTAVFGRDDRNAAPSGVQGEVCHLRLPRGTTVCGYRRGAADGGDGGRVPVGVDRAAARTDRRRELLEVHRAHAHLLLPPPVLRAETAAALPAHTSPGVVSNFSQCQIVLNCAIARARSRKVSCATVYLIFISLLTLCLGS